MAGFGRVALVGEYYGQSIVNVLWYRSESWLPLLGNPFQDMLNFTDKLLEHIQSAYLACMSNNYTFLRTEGTGYDDAFNVVTSTSVVRTVNQPGTIGAIETTGAVITAPLTFVLGPQHQINGTGQSKRNRGSVKIGPINELAVDNYGHIIGETLLDNLDALGALLDDTISGGLLFDWDYVPIRKHEKVQKVLGVPVLQWRTYSDIIGYRLPRKPGRLWRRLAEA